MICAVTPVFDEAIESFKLLTRDLQSQTFPHFSHVSVSNGESSKIRDFIDSLKDDRFIYVELPYEELDNPEKILGNLGIDHTLRVNQLADSDAIRIREMIDSDYVVEGERRREVAMNIKTLMDLGCYRGLRHRRRLPVRGQRTHTNARTRKGKAKPIAGKKK